MRRTPNSDPKFSVTAPEPLAHLVSSSARALWPQVTLSSIHPPITAQHGFPPASMPGLLPL